MSDRSLRRLVAQLGDLGEADLGHVLASLTAAQRTRVETLLEEGRNDAAPKRTQASGLAPVLAGRLDGKGEVAPHARKVLKDCAALIASAPEPAPPASLIGRLGGLLSR